MQNILTRYSEILSLPVWDRTSILLQILLVPVIQEVPGTVQYAILIEGTGSTAVLQFGVAAACQINVAEAIYHS